MPQQFMNQQEEAEYHTSYSQQKLRPRSRYRPRAKTIVVSCIILLCLVFVASALIGTITPQNSLTGTFAGWLFLSILFILALWALAKSLIFSKHWTPRMK